MALGRRKGQMFIITMVFLIGFVFAVQQNLFQYSALEVSEYIEQNDAYLLQNIKGLFSDALQSVTGCETAEECCSTASQKVSSLSNYLTSQILKGGYVLELGYSFLDCEANWETNNNVLKIDIVLISETTETKATYYFPGMGEPEI